MPWKTPTWKGAVGLLALLSSIITYLSTQPTTIGHGAEAVLGVIGGVLLLVERWADAQDYQTEQQAAANKALADAQTAIAAAQTAMNPSATGTITATPPAGSAPLTGPLPASP